MTKLKSHCGGFTLVEMMIVMIIIALAVALAVGVSADVRKHTRNETTRNVESLVLQALAVYKQACGEYPPAATDGGSCTLVRSLRAVPGSSGVLQKLPAAAMAFDASGNEVIIDGFGRELQYNPTGGLAGRSPALHSDGQNPDDPTDDIEIGM